MMQIKVFYSEITELFLILRQIFSGERFAPFNDAMEKLHSSLTEEEKKEIDDLGILSNGYLSALSHLIALHGDGPVEETSLLSDLLDDFSPLYKQDDETVNDERVQQNFDSLYSSYKQKSGFVKKIWSDGVSREKGKQSRRLLDELERLREYKKPEELLSYLQSISQRFTLEDGIIRFNIKPPLERDLDQIDRILLMPSLFATRKLTFWYEGNTLLFLVSLRKEEKSFPEPSDMHLLYTSALNDRTRLKMLKIIAAGSCTAGDLAVELGLNASTVSRHLKLFKDSGFIDISHNDGRQIVYGINRPGIRQALNELEQYISN